MKIGTKIIVIFLLSYWGSPAAIAGGNEDPFVIHFSFLGKAYSLKTQKIPGGFPASLNNANNFSGTIELLDTYCTEIIPELSSIRNKLSLSDWHYYQLIRKVSQQLIPKEKDYWGYTYCKWFFLARSGFRPVLCTIDDKLLLYIKSNSSIYNVPIKLIDAKQYVCMNYHDYNYDIPIELKTPLLLQSSFIKEGNDFDYSIINMPDFPEEKYVSKLIEFEYKGEKEKYQIKVCPETKDYFINYPVTDYRFQFNIPLSKFTYASLIPSLKTKLKGKSAAEGVEYIMFLVRNAFAYEADSSLYGREKRFSPEETLSSDWSDCEDHAGLFFTLVREVYDIPMIVLSYPDHVNVAVKLQKTKGIPIMHNGRTYTICEPTPQKKTLYLGQVPQKFRKQQFEVAYEYLPKDSLN
jgi:hypothetical protein